MLQQAPSAQSPDDSPESKATQAKLGKITLDKANFDKVDIVAVVDFLNKASKEKDPDQNLHYVVAKGVVIISPVTH